MLHFTAENIHLTVTEIWPFEVLIMTLSDMKKNVHVHVVQMAPCGITHGTRGLCWVQSLQTSPISQCRLPPLLYVESYTL